MTFNPQFYRTQIERQDDSNTGSRIHNESSKLPGHEERMKAHCERVGREYLSKHGPDGRFTKLYRDKRSRD